MEAQELHDIRLAQAQNCETRVNSLLEKEGIENILKFAKRVLAEVSFLRGISRATVDVKRLTSTNLFHLEAILDVLESHNAVAVQKKISARLLDLQTQQYRKVTCVVDVVADGGNVWYKVTARKASALHRVLHGQCDYGFKGFHLQLKELVNVAEHHPNGTSWPRVVAVFGQGCTADLKAHVEGLGVAVIGSVVPPPRLVESSDDNSDENDDEATQPHLADRTLSTPSASAQLNLDLFPDPNMAEEERREPVLPVLQGAMKGAQLVTCQTAWTSFQHIVSEIAGPRERARADELETRLTVLADAPYPAFEDSKLSRSKVVFGTGMSLKIPTLTANRSFLRSAAEKGLQCAAVVHSGRALTETHKDRWERRHKSS